MLTVSGSCGNNSGCAGVSGGRPAEGVLVVIKLFIWFDCGPMLRDASARGVVVLVIRRS